MALAFGRGRIRARESILNPKEGTILDVIDEASITFQKEAEREKNILNILRISIEKAKTALLETREKLEVLKKAGVVDAGGLSFLMILESYLETLGGKKKMTAFASGKEPLLKEVIQSGETFFRG